MKSNQSGQEPDLQAIAMILPYFTYSQELRVKAPLISYTCDWFGLNAGMRLLSLAKDDKQYTVKQTTDAKKFLLDKLGKLEQAKKEELQKGKDKDELQKESEYQLKNFILAVFSKCDQEEQAIDRQRNQQGKSFEQLKCRIADLCQDFYRCSHFIELMRVNRDDNSLPDDWNQKSKYCRFKAGFGLRCLDRGIFPPVGNPFDMPSEETKKLLITDKSFGMRKISADLLTNQHQKQNLTRRNTTNLQQPKTNNNQMQQEMQNPYLAYGKIKGDQNSQRPQYPVLRRNTIPVKPNQVKLSPQIPQKKDDQQQNNDLGFGGYPNLMP